MIRLASLVVILLAFSASPAAAQWYGHSSWGCGPAVHYGGSYSVSYGPSYYHAPRVVYGYGYSGGYRPSYGYYGHGYSGRSYGYRRSGCW